MHKIMIATHGHMASGIKSSIQILTGLQDQVVALDAYVDDHDYRQDIEEFIDQSQGSPCVILTDIIGGSVAQAAMMLRKNRKNVFVVCGVNLPVVLSLLMNTKPVTEELLNNLIQESQVQLVDFDKTSVNGHQEDHQNKDFFAV